ncbi:MAG: DUF4421 family protein [Prevotella sp.]|nr:DUF4421 family protein [Prevotella sp.]
MKNKKHTATAGYTHYAGRLMFTACLILHSLLFTTIALPSAAQSKRQKAKVRIDSVLNARYFSVKYDTTYIGRPQERLTLKLRTNISGSEFETHQRIAGAEGRGRLSTAHKATVSVGASYRGISVGLALNPGSLSGRNKDFELNVNAYANRYGIDVVYQNSQTLSGLISHNGHYAMLERGMADMKMLIVDAYYAFNGRRFSYPAAFTQSYFQKRSAGSWLVGFSYLGARIKTTEKKIAEDFEMKINVGHLGIGGGYGYNFVAGKHLLLHLSALPTLVIASYNNVEEKGQQLDIGAKFPDFILTERASLVWQFNTRYFMGATFVMSNSFLGDRSAEINYNKWRLRAFFGFRL